MLAQQDAPAEPEQPRSVPSEAPPVPATRPATTTSAVTSSPDVIVEEQELEDGTRVVSINPRVSVLYIDCYPTRGGGEVHDLGALIEEFKRRIEEEDNVPFWNADRYSKGKKLLTAMVKERIKQDPEWLRGKSVRANSRHEAMDVLLPEIVHCFDLVVEG